MFQAGENVLGLSFMKMSAEEGFEGWRKGLRVGIQKFQAKETASKKTVALFVRTDY